ncbi:MAG: hypothetical protein IPJ65_17985 [Archangiaceae bacterium]|nr:hypothetical protein [Archangiaceae bacterium]
MGWSGWSLLVLCGCGVAELEAVQLDEMNEEAQQKEAWSAADSPYLFSADLETRLDALPLAGEAAHVPWPGSYWPVSGDSINLRWGSGDSAAKKYERAFGGSGVEDAVSRAHGIEGATGQRACVRDGDCDAQRGESCALRRGKSSGRCIPGWWGICHAWTPAAMLWPEPRRAVVRNGVTFEPQDLKALASLVHDRTKTKFASLRCGTQLGSFAFDHYGRPTDASCRDTNAGTYHVLLANWLGRMRQPFAEDRTIDDEVWNQPLRSYRVLSKREVGAAEANRLVGAGGSVWSFNPGAARLVAVSTEVKYVSESEPSVGYVGSGVDPYTRSDRYDYVLELDRNGKIIGGEWGQSSQKSHPDFVWLPLGPAADSAAGGAIKYETVKQLVLESASAAPVSSGVGTVQVESLVLPAGAWRLVGPYSTGAGEIRVEMTGTGDADLFVRVGGQASTALFDCRPWLSSSNESCTLKGPGPVYVAVHADRASNVTVRTRFTAAAGVPKLSASGSVAVGEMKVFSMTVTAGRALTVRTAAAGDVDLYVRASAAPTAAVYDARAISESGNSRRSPSLRPRRRHEPFSQEGLRSDRDGAAGGSRVRRDAGRGACGAARRVAAGGAGGGRREPSTVPRRLRLCPRAAGAGARPAGRSSGL